MTRLTKGTWVLVTDSEKALFLKNETDGTDPYLTVVKKETQDNPPTRDQAANERGRKSDGSSGHKSAMDDTDWHELAKERFAADLADMLYKRAHKGEFERIVIVADPNTLGELRSQLHKEVSDKVIGEIPKTLTNHPLDEIEKMVKAELAQS
ncbi:protein required for attachment to host cells [Sulfitobacter undariae]|uniref:Protein required for attachment to host cells n=1 Tax=Sulfitobacter undariae TaxID=1563671 RepID=A0A7W6H0W2_9RHOB|nr:host attachment family protein [Sulfitobacter undariae]MBB3995341.1 protein required for attachment to host cells [Sulfitobacter undariae]